MKRRPHSTRLSRCIYKHSYFGSISVVRQEAPKVQPAPVEDNQSSEASRLMASHSSNGKAGSSTPNLSLMQAADTVENYNQRYHHAHSDTRSKKSEKKRLWRQGLSEEQIRKMRERDAERKRAERKQMTLEQRRIEREKDARRKALKRQRVKEEQRLAAAMSISRILNKQ